jgi:hypothetical protein
MLSRVSDESSLAGCVYEEEIKTYNFRCWTSDGGVSCEERRGRKGREEPPGDRRCMRPEYIRTIGDDEEPTVPEGE